MAKAFRPSIWIDSDGVTKPIEKTYPTYTELKRDLKNLFKEYDPVKIHVFRHRRGEWGEWFEHWSLVNGKPKIVKQGWM